MKNHKVVCVKEIPSGEDFICRDSSFFLEKRGDLPSPEEIRKKGLETGDYRAKTDRPLPVVFEEEGLLVKYGSYITIAEGQCLWFFNRYMRETVPTPELFGWVRDGDETFIYMQLVRASTMAEVWPSLSSDNKDSICMQLRSCVESWCSLRQEADPYFIGHIGRRGVGDIIFSDVGDANPGPFDNLTDFHNFFARYSCRRHPERNPRRDFPELAGLSDDQPVVFTHADLDMTNILVSISDGGTPRIVAIIDWHQSGWYPRDWEWLKAWWQCEWLEEGGRDSAWLEKVIEPAGYDYTHAWEFITGSL